MRYVRSKIQGSMLGALMGDCLAAPFEGDAGPLTASLYKNYFEGLRKEDVAKKLPYKRYTDDTAMAMAVAESLVERKGFDARDMAIRFTDEYFKSPRRGYGGSVVNVFYKLRRTRSENPFEPAALQFNGSGSYGNGAAMRAFPVALFFSRCDTDKDKLMQVAIDQGRITHANSTGYHGALLQCLAVSQAFLADPGEVVNIEEFCKAIGDKIRNVEAESEESLRESGGAAVFSAKMKRLEALAKQAKDRSKIDFDIVIRDLGNNISALESVPTAIFCYLMAQDKTLECCQGDSVIERSIQLAIALGGDTDTIATMAAAIAGAHVGVEDIPEVLLKHCEARDRVRDLADRIYAHVVGGEDLQASDV